MAGILAGRSRMARFEGRAGGGGGGEGSNRCSHDDINDEIPEGKGPGQVGGGAARSVAAQGRGEPKPMNGGAEGRGKPKSRETNGVAMNRNGVSLQQKHTWLMRWEALGGSTKTWSVFDQGAWWRKTFDAEISITTLQRLRKPDSIEEIKCLWEGQALNGGATASSMRPGRVSRVHALNEALATWFRDRIESSDCPCNDSALILKAKQLVDHGIRVPDDFKFSKTNWLQDFKKKVLPQPPVPSCSPLPFLPPPPHSSFSLSRAVQIKFGTKHGEGGSADIEGIKRARDAVPNFIGDTPANRLYNMDATGVFFSCGSLRCKKGSRAG